MKVYEFYTEPTPPGEDQHVVWIATDRSVFASDERMLHEIDVDPNDPGVDVKIE